MWTPRHRTRHETRLKDVVVQASLDEVARFLERADPPARPNAQPVRLVMAAIAWHLRTGGAWRDLPAGFPPWRRVYGLVPSLDREKPVRGPDAGSGLPTASPLRASSRATAGDHRHAKRQVSRRARPPG